tara:strand:+ start:172 stop:363 length:192 start_codon:yes stop_codon:yes gene_type:complete
MIGVIMNIKKHFNNLYNNLIDSEITNYMESFDVSDPTEKPVNELKESNYKDLRILKNYFEESL